MSCIESSLIVVEEDTAPSTVCVVEKYQALSEIISSVFFVSWLNISPKPFASVSAFSIFQLIALLAALVGLPTTVTLLGNVL